MRVAKVCNEWEIIFSDLKTEDDVSLHNRSYLHYAASHKELVAAKAWATKWLLEDIVDTNKEYSAREYMGGIGIQSLLIQNLFKIKKHTIGELDEGCIKHLSTNDWKKTPIVLHQNVNDAIKDDEHYDFKFADFPNSSILQITTKWKNIFYKLFESKPTLVVWTDTSVTYPMSIHGEKYSKILSSKISNKYEYVNAYSFWLYDNFGYSIKRAAFRGKNAVYFAAVEHQTQTEIKEFPISNNLDGFYFVDEENNTLDKFF